MATLQPIWPLLNMILPKLYLNKKKYRKKIGKGLALLRLLPVMAVASNGSYCGCHIKFGSVLTAHRGGRALSSLNQV